MKKGGIMNINTFWLNLCFIITIVLIFLRVNNSGWNLIFLGPSIYLPLLIMYLISMTKGFAFYFDKMSNQYKYILFINLFLPILFVLFQYDGGDNGGRYVYNSSYSEGSNPVLDTISIFAGAFIFYFNLILLRHYKEISKKNNEAIEQENNNSKNNNGISLGDESTKQASNISNDSARAIAVDDSVSRDDSVYGDKFLVIMFYIILIVSSFIPVIPLFLPFILHMSKKDNFATFHANQQFLIVFVAIMAQLILILGFFIFPTLMLLPFILIIEVIFLLIGLLDASQGKIRPIFIVSKFMIFK